MARNTFSIHLRHDAKVGDLVVDLHREGYLGLDPRFMPGTLEGFLEHVSDTMRTTDVTDPDKCKIWIADINGKPSGCSALIIHPNGRGQIRWVIVTKEGRGLGLGKTLIHETVNMARKLGLTGLHLETIGNLDAAKTIYETLGFKVTERIPTEFWYGHDDMIIMAMEL